MNVAQARTTGELRSATRRIGPSLVQYGDDICKQIAKVFLVERNIKLNIDALIDDEGFPEELSERPETELTEPYWWIEWTDRQSLGKDMGSAVQYYRQKTYTINIQAVQAVEELKLDASWGTYVEQCCDWFESHGTLWGQVKKIAPPAITAKGRRKHRAGIRYYFAAITCIATNGDQIVKQSRPNEG